MKRLSLTALACTLILGLAGMASSDNCLAGETIRISCSNQVFHAFQKEDIESFTQSTGIQTEVYTSSSGSAVYRMMSGYSDIAVTARGLYRHHRDSGYNEIPICKDPLAIITKEACGVDSLTTDQLTQIFSGTLTNWKEVGGADLPIMVIVPGTDTAANKNFRRQVMKHGEIDYDFMAYDSTMVIEAVKNFPCGAISFTSQGAVSQQPPVKSIKIDGYGPSDPNYSYYQTFYYITKGTPEGIVKQFIDFTFSDAGIQIIQRNGMQPIAR
ncbi:MAG: substrate-binding domain-containing protein [Desulfobacterales bacterium]